MAKLDPNRGWQAVQERLDRTSDPRHRALLENLRDHLRAEASGDFELLVSTLAANPEYHFWVPGSGLGSGPKGLEQVVGHYRRLYEERRNVLEYAIERIVVDDDTIVTEGWYDQIYPGSVLRSRGVDVDDPQAAYLVRMRLTLFWPYDADGKLVGEDSYSDGEMFRPERIRKLSRNEIPGAYFEEA